MKVTLDFSRNRKFILILIVIMVLVIVATCFFALKNRPKTLKIGIMPDMDSVQVVVAAKLCDNVETVLFTDAVSRSSAFRCGAVDLCVSDILTAVCEIGGGRDDCILTVTSGRYSLVSHRQYTTLENQTVAISQGTVIEYAADRLLKDIPFRKVPVNSITARISALKSGNVSAAVLPEPYASLSLTPEFYIAAECEEQDIGILSCSGKALTEKRQLIEEFLLSFEKSAEMINLDPECEAVREAFQDLSLPEAFGNVRLPTYRPPKKPTEKAIIDVCDYLEENNICTPDRKGIEKSLSSF